MGPGPAGGRGPRPRLSGRDGPRRGDLRTGPLDHGAGPGSAAPLPGAPDGRPPGVRRRRAGDGRFRGGARDGPPVQTGGADRTLQGLVAVERGDRAALRAAAGAQRVGLLQGAGIDAMAGALRALDGDAAGLAAMDAAADFLDQAGVQFSAALVRRARAIVVPGDAGACRAAQAAVATFDRLGARTMRRGLESLLQGAARDEASRDEATATRRRPAKTRKCRCRTESTRFGQPAPMSDPPRHRLCRDRAARRHEHAGLVIDGKVVSTGKIPTPWTIAAWLTEA